MAEGAERPEADETMSIWVPWDRPLDAIVHPHDFCRFWPLDDEERYVSPPWADGEDFPLYLQGWSRWMVRHTPSILFLTLIVIKGIPLGIDGYQSAEKPGILAKMPYFHQFTPNQQLLIGIVGVGVWIVILAVAVGIKQRSVDSGAPDSRMALLKPPLVYSVLVLSAVGTAIAVIAAMGTNDPDLGVFADFGFWFAFLLGGMLVYDGMLRTERLFWFLGYQAVIQCQEDGCDRYEEFRENLADALAIWKDRILGIVPRAYFVTYTFVGLFVAVAVGEHVATGRFGGIFDPNGVVMDLLRSGFNLILVLVAYQFAVLIGFFYRLVTDEFPSNSEVPVLGYAPHHPDGFAGYRDLGHFAIRVNAILIIAGLYLAYQIFLGSFLAVESVIPLLIYAITAGAWLYYSFWMLHQKMLKERKRWVAAGGPPEGTELSDDYMDEHGLDRTDLREAPVWPVSSRALQSIVSANLVPLILGLIELMSGTAG